MDDITCWRKKLKIVDLSLHKTSFISTLSKKKESTKMLLVFLQHLFEIMFKYRKGYFQIITGCLILVLGPWIGAQGIGMLQNEEAASNPRLIIEIVACSIVFIISIAYIAVPRLKVCMNFICVVQKIEGEVGLTEVSTINKFWRNLVLKRN